MVMAFVGFLIAKKKVPKKKKKTNNEKTRHRKFKTTQKETGRGLGKRKTTAIGCVRTLVKNDVVCEMCKGHAVSF